MNQITIHLLYLQYNYYAYLTNTLLLFFCIITISNYNYYYYDNYYDNLEQKISVKTFQKLEWGINISGKNLFYSITFSKHLS